MPQDYRELYPMLNILFLGPSGIGKTTALELAFKYLVRPLTDGPAIIEGKPSPQKLHWDLRAAPHTILYAEELAAFITKEKFMEGMVAYLTKLFNYLPQVEERTKKDDLIVVDKPEVCLLGGSTVKWLQEQLPNNAMAGGFLPRFLIVHEEHAYQRLALPHLALGRGQLARLERDRDKVSQEFAAIVGEYEGVVNFADYSVADVFTLWHSTHQPESGHLQPFAQRAGEYILRLSMLVALSCHRNRIVEEDVHAAIKLYTYCERTLKDVVVPYSLKGNLLQLVLDAIGHRPMPQTAIRHAMRHYETAQEVDKLIESLIMSGDLKRTDNHRLVRTT